LKAINNKLISYSNKQKVNKLNIKIKLETTNNKLPKLNNNLNKKQNN